jgi:hypothetical protein
LIGWLEHKQQEHQVVEVVVMYKELKYNHFYNNFKMMQMVEQELYMKIVEDKWIEE